MADGSKLLSFDIQRIMQLLPHRYPFLMIDRVIEVDGDNSAIGIKNVTANEPHFTGHFPGHPIMPGVLLVEGMAQTAGAICVASRGGERPGVVYFMTIDECKFRRPVVPGDTVQFRVRKLRNRANVWKFSGEAYVGEAKVAEAIISALIAEDYNAGRGED
ncbi:MAG: 3-hydroxyacyl-ACP dehydratase FabZ [Rhizobiales bacterium]|nr:3-hydroxyacyl-ACP dehydratase FabZ [Hyphomicrobiales bacterium]MBN9009073.1 3-hydroxyacyl-ACP dehydratase FabZ [Hyphomicrobiales bacterium]